MNGHPTNRTDIQCDAILRIIDNKRKQNHLENLHINYIPIYLRAISKLKKWLHIFSLTVMLDFEAFCHIQT